MLTYNLESHSAIFVCWFHLLFIYLFTLQWNLFTTEWDEFLIMTNSCLLMPTLPFSLCDELLLFFVFCRPIFVRRKDIPVVLCTLPECRFQRDGEMSLIRFCCMHSVASICWCRTMEKENAFPGLQSSAPPLMMSSVLLLEDCDSGVGQ